MANQGELTRWIVTHGDQLDLRCTQFSWIGRRFPRWFDIGARISVQGRPFVGRGADLDGDTALAKAFCEAVERAVCFDYGIKTTGVAGHIEFAPAAENATNELFERLSLYLHFREKRPLELLESSPLAIPIQSDGAASLNLTEHKFRMFSPDGHSCVCVLIEGLSCAIPIGGLLGLGCHREEAIAYRKARIEALANAEALGVKNRKGLSKKEFGLLPNPSSADRQALLLHPGYLKTLLEDLFRISEISPLNKSFPALRLEIEPLPIRAPELAGCPLFFARARASGYNDIDLEFVG
jgi:ribosomal protein S12 methylthiotransferase accessory factor YcaO